MCVCAGVGPERASVSVSAQGDDAVCGGRGPGGRHGNGVGVGRSQRQTHTLTLSCSFFHLLVLQHLEPADVPPVLLWIFTDRETQRDACSSLQVSSTAQSIR